MNGGTEDQGRETPEPTVAGRLNACFDCLDRHIRDGRGDNAAIIYDAPVISFQKTITFADLLDEVQSFAAVLSDLGIGRGDAVLLHLPMIPRAHVAALACARLGAGFATVPVDGSSADLAAQLDAVRPKVLLTASCAVAPDRVIPLKPTVDAALDRAAAKPVAVLVWQRPRCQASMVAGRDHDWEALIEVAEGDGRRIYCVAVAAEHPLMFEPAAHGAVGIAAQPVGAGLAAMAAEMRMGYGLSPGDVFWCAADVGSARGRREGLLAPLSIGAATICYEGEPVGTPDAGAFWRVCSQHRVAALVLPMSAVRAIAAADGDGLAVRQHDLSGLRTLKIDTALAGTDAGALDWIRRHVPTPVATIGD